MSLNKGSLNKAIQTLKVKQIEIINQGAGANSILDSNSGSQIAKFNGHLSLGLNFLLYSGKSFYATLAHDITADRVITFPDKDITIADDVAREEQELIGVANKDWCALIFEGSNPIGLVTNNMGHIANVGDSDGDIGFMLPMPTNKGSLTLKMVGWRYYQFDADGGNKVLQLRIIGKKADGSSMVILDTGVVAYNAIQEYSDSFSVEDLGDYRSIHVYMEISTTVQNDWDMFPPELDLYYD